MLSTASVPQLTGSTDTARKELPKEAPLQMLLIPGQSILLYDGCLRYSVRFPIDTWKQILKILSDSEHEISEVRIGVPGAIEFPHKAKGEAKTKG